MASKSHLTYSTRASQHTEPVVKRLFELAETKNPNVIVSADLTNTSDLLDLADRKDNCLYNNFVIHIANPKKVLGRILHCLILTSTSSLISATKPFVV